MKHIKTFEKYQAKYENVIEEVVHKFIDLGFVELESLDIEEDHFKINSIKGKQFGYFLDNYLIVEADRDIAGVS